MNRGMETEENRKRKELETGRGGNLEKLGRKWKRGLAGEKGDGTRNEMEEKGVENGREGGGGGKGGKKCKLGRRKGEGKQETVGFLYATA